MMHLMVDLETLDVRPSAVVMSFGACVFDKEGIHHAEHYLLDQDEQLRQGRTVSASTVSWWMNQSPEARAVFNPTQEPLSLYHFSKVVADIFSRGQLFLWGNGSDFDTAILIDMWQRHDLPKVANWKYSNHMCFRTFNKLYNCKSLVVREGVHHNAMDDAVYQAECVIAAVKLGAPLP